MNNMNHKYEGIMDAYKEALNVLEKFTGIDAHSMSVKNKEKQHAALINSALRYSFNRGTDYANILLSKAENDENTKKELSSLEEAVQLYKDSKIKNYQDIPSFAKDKSKYVQANAKDVLNDTLTAFYLGALDRLENRKHSKTRKICDYVDNKTLYVDDE